VFCRNRSGLASAERERVVTTCVSDVRKKATVCANNQRRHRYELIGNRLYSLLPIRQRSVTDLSSPLLIGHLSVMDFTSLLPIGLTFVTGSFNIRYKEFR
jgi:hypothetical protein